MKKYITEEAVLDIVTDWCPDDDGSVGKSGDLREMLDELEAIPAADVVEVRHGRQIILEECSNRGIYCSECHCKVFDFMHKPKKKQSNYCPNCGAKMDGGMNNAVD